MIAKGGITGGVNHATKQKASARWPFTVSKKAR
jgi:hypothetical protein